MRAESRQIFLGCIAAALATALAAGVRRFLLDETIAPPAPSFLFLLPVIVAAWIGGLVPGLLATGLALLAGLALAFGTAGWGAHPATIQLNSGLFVAAGAALSLCSELMHRTRRRVGEQQESLRITLASIGDAVITTDAAGLVTSLNPVAVALTGWREKEAVGRPLDTIFRIINERSRQPVANPVQKVLSAGKSVGLANHTLLIAKDGTERPIDDSAAPIRDSAGTIRGVVLVFRDITLRRQEEKVRARLAAIVESSADAILSKDLRGTITSWNRGAEQLYGYSAEEAVGRPVAILIPPELPNEFPSIMERLQRGERVEHYDTVRLRKDGRRVEVSLSISPVQDSDGQVVGASAVARDNTERLRLIRELHERDDRKDEFLATLAHELRNPLAPIRNGLEVLRLAGNDANAVAQARAVMERQFHHAVRLIDDLLDVSRIVRHKLQLRRERVELAKVIEQAVECARSQIEASGQKLTVSMPPEPIYIDADRARLVQVFSNLLNNAAKYTDPGGSIWLGAELEHGPKRDREREESGKEERRVRISVRDTGIGFSAEQLPHIFDMFVQFDRSLERSQGGLGVGLTLTKRLVELHGGEIDARSEGPNKGAEFVVQLPATPGEPVAPHSCSDDCNVASPASQCKVLVVDDNEDAATSLRMLLRIMGHLVLIAHDGLEALAVAESFQPHLVLLDISLPKLDGYQVARRIREASWGQEMKLIALTGWGQEDDKRRSREAGFDFHLVKPVEPAALEELLRKLCPA